MSDTWNYSDIPQPIPRSPLAAGSLALDAGLTDIGSEPLARSPAPAAQPAAPPARAEPKDAKPDLSEQYKSLIESRQREQEPLLREQERLAREPLPAPPRQQRVPQAPQQDLGQNAMMWLAAATAMGAMAGALTRRGSINALKSFSGALDGFKAGDEARFNANFKQWEAQRKEINDNNQSEQTEYENIIKRRDLDQRQMANLIQISATRWHNQFVAQVAAEAARSGNAEMMFAALDARDGQIAQMYMAGNKLSQMQQNRQDRIDNAKEIVKGMEEGTQSPVTTGLYGSAPFIKRLQQQRNEERQAQGQPPINWADRQLHWASAVKQVQTLGAPNFVKIAGLIKGVTNTIDEVSRLSHELKLNGVPAANYVDLVQLVQTHPNDPRAKIAAKYIAAVNTLKSEFANAENGGYAPTEEVWKLANAQIRENYSTAMMDASLSEVKTLLNMRLTAFPMIKEFGPGAPNPYFTGDKGTKEPGPQQQGLPPGVTVEPWDDEGGP